MKIQLKQLIFHLLQELIKKGTFVPCSPNFVVEVPKLKEHGEYSTNVAMLMAQSQKTNPRKIAEVLKEELAKNELFERIEVAGPGFINMWLKPSCYQEALKGVLELGQDYGRSQIGKGKRVLIEYVSANPTGPLHLGHGRGAAFGDTLSRILEFCSYEVTREFYINDAGRQVRLLGLSIYSRYRQRKDPSYPFPEEGYHGTYVEDLLNEILTQVDLEALDPEEAVKLCARLGKELMLKEIREDLEGFQVHFDVWTSEEELYRSKKVEMAINTLKDKGLIYEEEGAVWLRTTAFGDDKDRVIRKSDGEYTYFASDIAYHWDKWQRGYDLAIDIWGADHHGYINRVIAALSCLGIPKEWLQVLLIQLVKLWSKGEEIKMSKRAGTYVTLKELISEAGIDATRFIFLTKHNDTTLDFDLDLAKRQDTENPVYYIQYAHARISSILRKSPYKDFDKTDITTEILKKLTLEEEIELIKGILDFPYVIEEIAKTFEPHRLTYYLWELSSQFHRYFNLGNKEPDKRVICSDEETSIARLALVVALRNVIYRGLTLLGVKAPEAM